ncbi:Sec-independent protein translocase subunit TatA/TatB [Demequina pelophila]|uniref:Sec-independent protein translocase subunit TatA/TatB n=1 Tax=Demequina pelophila TaxID=1638984 RepID=UPI000783A57D|nr:hypothetical protein [Demequina pelophila]
MFGLTMDKVLLIVVLAAFVLGPSRLPGYAQRLGELVRQWRDYIETTRVRTEQETGIALDRASWQAWDVRQYDPRQIVREALAGEPVASSAAASPTAPSPAAPSPAAGPEPASPAPEPESMPSGSTPLVPDPAPAESPAAAKRQRWVVVGGTSGHPIRRLVDVEPDTEADTTPPPAPDADVREAAPTLEAADALETGPRGKAAS